MPESMPLLVPSGSLDVPTRFATNRGCRIAFYTLGPEDGVPVVFQHGLTQNKESFHEYALDFAEAGFRAILVDSLGHGESDKPQNANMYTREQRAADIISVLDAENIDKAHYIGYSMVVILLKPNLF